MANVVFKILDVVKEQCKEDLNVMQKMQEIEKMFDDFDDKQEEDQDYIFFHELRPEAQVDFCMKYNLDPTKVGSKAIAKIIRKNDSTK